MSLHNKKLEGMRVAILVEDDFEQVEMTEPRKALELAGAQCRIISSKPGVVQGMNHDEKADTFKVDRALDQVTPDDFDAVLLPGGALNSDKLRSIPRAQEFVRKFNASNKPMAIICHAPWLLVSAGLVKSRKLTSYYTIQDDIRNAGGNWVDQEVVLDNNWVTSRRPGDIAAFNNAAIELFAENKTTMAGQRTSTINPDTGFAANI